MEVRLRCGVLARLYQLLANATTGARGVHEERANARGVASRVEQRVVVRGPVAIPAEQRLALTPSATANDALAVVFHDKIGTVDDGCRQRIPCRARPRSVPANNTPPAAHVPTMGSTRRAPGYRGAAPDEASSASSTKLNARRSTSPSWLPPRVSPKR